MLLSFQWCGTGKCFYYKIDLIDYLHLFYKFISCIHSIGGIFPCIDINIATVLPNTFLISGLWYQSSDGI